MFDKVKLNKENENLEICTLFLDVTRSHILVFRNLSNLLNWLNRKMEGNSLGHKSWSLSEKKILQKLLCECGQCRHKINGNNFQ